MRSNLNVWEPSLRAEFEQLVKTKGAVTQISESQLQELAPQRGLPIDLLPAEMVHTRKAGSGACRSRAVVCVCVATTKIQMAMSAMLEGLMAIKSGLKSE